MSGGLVRNEIGDDPSPNDFGKDLCAVPHQAHGEWFPLVLRRHDPREGFLQAVGGSIAVAGIQTPLDAGRIHLHRQDGTLVEGGREGLGSPHPSKPPGEDPTALQRTPEVHPGHGPEGFVRTLKNPLGPDVDP